MNRKEQNKVEEYAHLKQVQFVYGVLDVFFEAPIDKDIVIMLCGDAGTGKSYTIELLLKKLSNLNVRELVEPTTTTHAASSCFESNIKTIYSALMLNDGDLLSCSAQEVSAKLAYKYPEVIQWKEQFDENIESIMDKSKALGHKCEFFSTRCKTCMALYKRRCALPPEGKSFYIIDEVGMLDGNTTDKIIEAARFFSPLGCGNLFLFIGSVSQLRVPGQDGIWRAKCFEHMWLGTAYMNYNYRLRNDYVFADALACMQHNLITKTCVDIMKSCVIPANAENTKEFMPDAVRIFNSNTRRDEYNSRVLNSKETVDCLPVLQNHEYCSSQLKNLIWTKFKKRYGTYTQMNLKLYKDARVICYKINAETSYFQGVVTGFRKPDIIYVKTDKGEEKIVTRQEFILDSRSPKIRFFPIVHAQAINTFTAQGATMRCPVIYCPPEKNYFMSKILPSAYVACTRVTKKSNLFLTRNSFANTVGKAPFFTQDLLDFKEQYEMNYDYEN